MKTITYNPETHVLVPREPSEEMFRSMTDGFISINGDNRSQFNSGYYSMLAAAPQPEQVDVEPVAWWNGKETAFFEHEVDGPVGEVRIPLYTTPQPGRTAELEAALKVARDALDTCTHEGFCDYDDATDALAKINEVLKP